MLCFTTRITNCKSFLYFLSYLLGIRFDYIQRSRSNHYLVKNNYNTIEINDIFTNKATINCKCFKVRIQLCFSIE